MSRLTPRGIYVMYTFTQFPRFMIQRHGKFKASEPVDRQVIYLPHHFWKVRWRCNGRHGLSKAYSSSGLAMCSLALSFEHSLFFLKICLQTSNCGRQRSAVLLQLTLSSEQPNPLTPLIFLQVVNIPFQCLNDTKEHFSHQDDLRMIDFFRQVISPIIQINL